MSENFLKNHQPRSVLCRVAAIAAPPEVAEPATIRKLEILLTDSAEVDSRTSTSATVNLSRLASVAADDGLVVSIDDYVLSWPTWVSASTSPTTAKGFTPVPFDDGVTAFSTRRKIRVTCGPTLCGAIVSGHGRVAS